MSDNEWDMSSLEVMKCLLVLCWHSFPLQFPLWISHRNYVCEDFLFCCHSIFGSVVHMTAGLFLARNIVQKRKKNPLFLLFMSSTQMNHTDLSKKCLMSAHQHPELCTLDVKVGHQMGCKNPGEEASKGDSVTWQSSWDDCGGSQLRHINRKWYLDQMCSEMTHYLTV